MSETFYTSAETISDDLNKIQTLLSEGYTVTFSKTQVVPTTFNLSFKVLLVPCALPAEDGTLAINIKVHDGLLCDFHCYVGQTLNTPVVSNTVKHLFSKDDYMSFCQESVQSAYMRGLATDDAYLKGSIFYLRGKGLFITSLFEILTAFQECYWNRVQNFFAACKDGSPEGIINFCRNYYHSNK